MDWLWSESHLSVLYKHQHLSISLVLLLWSWSPSSREPSKSVSKSNMHFFYFKCHPHCVKQGSAKHTLCQCLLLQKSIYGAVHKFWLAVSTHACNKLQTCCEISLCAFVLLTWRKVKLFFVKIFLSWGNLRMSNGHCVVMGKLTTQCTSNCSNKHCWQFTRYPKTDSRALLGH